MAKAWAKFPYSDKKYQYTAATLKKTWDRLHKGDAEALPEERRAGRRLDRLSRRRIPEGRRAGAEGRRRRHERRQQGAGDLRQLPRGKRQAQARAVPGGGRAGRGTAEKRTEESERVLLAGLRAGSLRAGHLGRQGADAGHRRQGQDGARDGDQARAEARRCAYRARVLSRRSDRQGRRDDRRDDLWRQEGHGTEEFPDGAQAGTQIRRSRASSTPTAW